MSTLTVDEEIEVIGIAEFRDEFTDMYSFTSNYVYNGVESAILVSEDLPAGYEREHALELKWLRQMEVLVSHDGLDMENTQRQQDYVEGVELEIKDIALPLLKHLAPFSQK